MKTRIILGSILAGLTAGMLFIDHLLSGPAPCLFVVAMCLAGFGAAELVRMLPEATRPQLGLCVIGCLTLIAAHWLSRFETSGIPQSMPLVFQGYVGFVLIAFVGEMARYDSSGRSTSRVASAIWVVAYLGLLPGFLVQLRLSESSPVRGTQALILAIFVPKLCDIGAYFTGRLLGRHKMSPVLSPKKTWEGALGGVCLGTVGAIAIESYRPIIPGGWIGAVGFGATVSIAGILGDLAESMIKRDAGTKDAGSALPEFGGVLDVVDAILFAAPVTYWWLR